MDWNCCGNWGPEQPELLGNKTISSMPRESVGLRLHEEKKEGKDVEDTVRASFVLLEDCMVVLQLF